MQHANLIVFGIQNKPKVYVSIVPIGGMYNILYTMQCISIKYVVCIYVLPLLRVFLKRKENGKQQAWAAQWFGLFLAWKAWHSIVVQQARKQAERLGYSTMEMTFYHQPNFPNTACLTTLLLPATDHKTPFQGLCAFHHHHNISAAFKRANNQ